LVAAFEPNVDPEERPRSEDRKPQQRRRRQKRGPPDFDRRTEADRLFGVDLRPVPGLMMLVFMLFSEGGGTGREGPRRDILCLGWGCAPITTSAEEEGCGGAAAEQRTGPEHGSDERPILCIATRRRWGTSCAA
jgi:hypothetical protein